MINSWTSASARYVPNVEHLTVMRVRRILGRNLKFYPALEGHLLMMQVVPKRTRFAIHFDFSRLRLSIGVRTCAALSDSVLEATIIADLQVFNEMYRINKASLP